MRSNLNLRDVKAVSRLAAAPFKYSTARQGPCGSSSSQCRDKVAFERAVIVHQIGEVQGLRNGSA